MGKAPLAIAKVVELINVASYNAASGLAEEVAAFGALFDTVDAKEGANAFLEKRKAGFVGS